MLLPALVVHKQLVDNVPKAIDEQLVLGISRGLQDALATGFGLDSHDARERRVKLLAEPPRIAEKREKFIARQKRLLAAQDELLDAFENTQCTLISCILLARRVYYVLTEIFVPIVEIVPGIWRTAAT
jgi:Dynamin GTPase effector domain